MNDINLSNGCREIGFGSDISAQAPHCGGAETSSGDRLERRLFIAFNGGPHYKLAEAISLFVTCETQEEVDSHWSLLTADGGEESRCGWLT